MTFELTLPIVTQYRVPANEVIASVTVVPRLWFGRVRESERRRPTAAELARVVVGPVSTRDRGET